MRLLSAFVLCSSLLLGAYLVERTTDRRGVSITDPPAQASPSDDGFPVRESDVLRDPPIIDSSEPWTFASTIILPVTPAVTQEQLGRIIVMVAEGWTEWPTTPVCEDLGRGWKEVPCRVGDWVITRDPPVEETIDPDHHEMTTKWGL